MTIKMSGAKLDKHLLTMCDLMLIKKKKKKDVSRYKYGIDFNLKKKIKREEASSPLTTIPIIKY